MMKKRDLALAKFLVAGCFLSAVVMFPGCSSDQPDEQGDDQEAQQPPKDLPTFTEDGKATLTFKGKTLEFCSAVGILRPGAKLMEVHFYPYKLTKEQKAALLKGESPGSVNSGAKGHDPQNWPHKPTFGLRIRFKEDSQSHTTEDIERCSLLIRNWAAAGSTNGVPLESTVKTLKLDGLQTGGQLTLAGTAKGQYDEKTTVTFEAKTVVIADTD
ncbi:MAG: hypothetical protein ISS69_02500 [Phycisphaerae bacterium]|nr:hypothetical protein [Phycisphaerae bacterium]